MKFRSLLLGLGALLSAAHGCTAVPEFPANGAQTMKASSEFGVLVAKPDSYKGRAVRLAGRMVGVERTEQGTVIMAEWLPFPKPGDYGPYTQSLQPERFAVLYPGPVDAWGTWHGNKFLVAGKVEGSKDIVTLEGTSKKLPYFVARCLHVWKTGDSDFSSDAGDIEQSGFPPMEETYCMNS